MPRWARTACDATWNTGSRSTRSATARCHSRACARRTSTSRTRAHTPSSTACSRSCSPRSCTSGTCTGSACRCRRPVAHAASPPSGAHRTAGRCARGCTCSTSGSAPVQAPATTAASAPPACGNRSRWMGTGGAGSPRRRCWSSTSTCTCAVPRACATSTSRTASTRAGSASCGRKHPARNGCGSRRACSGRSSSASRDRCGWGSSAR